MGSCTLLTVLYENISSKIIYFTPDGMKKSVVKLFILLLMVLDA